MIIRMRKIIPPMIRLFPPTNEPKVDTTFPGFPLVRISFVEETLREILKIVVNSKSVGKKDISKTSCTNRTFIRTINAMDILNAIITSSKKLGIGMIKNATAASKYSAIPTSVFLTDAAKSITRPPFP